MTDMREQISTLVEGLRLALSDPDCPLELSPLLMECSQTLRALSAPPPQDGEVVNDPIGELAHRITGDIARTCCHKTGGFKEDPRCDCRAIAKSLLDPGYRERILKIFAASPLPPDVGVTEEELRQAVTDGNKAYWRGARLQEEALSEWVCYGFNGDRVQLSGGSIVDHITRAVLALINSKRGGAS